MKFQSPKTLKINDSIFLHIYYANSRGRGRNNVSIVATSNPVRTGSVKTQTAAGYIGMARTGAWTGNVEIGPEIFAELSIEANKIEVIQ